jgi:hypothetical protein
MRLIGGEKQREAKGEKKLQELVVVASLNYWFERDFCFCMRRISWIIQIVFLPSADQLSSSQRAFRENNSRETRIACCKRKRTAANHPPEKVNPS